MNENYQFGNIKEVNQAVEIAKITDKLHSGDGLEGFDVPITEISFDTCEKEVNFKKRDPNLT